LVEYSVLRGSLRGQISPLPFAASLDRATWLVTWIHLNRARFPICVRFRGELKKIRNIQDFDIYELYELLSDDEVSRKHLVLIDGFDSDADKHLVILKVCNEWLNIDKGW
jgi:hypothetical protein